MIRVVTLRILSIPPFLVGVSLACFLLVYLAPGTIIDTLMSQPGMNAELIDSLRADYGYDLPWYRQYWAWLTGVVSGDWGESFRFQRPVSELVWSSLPYTACLVLGGFVLSSAAGVGLSIWGLGRSRQFVDRSTHLGALTLGSVHPIVLCLSLLVLASMVDWLPVGGIPESGLAADVWLVEWLRHAALPVVALSLSMLPGFYLQSRGLLLEIVQGEHVRAARAAGQSDASVIWRHVLPVATGPLVSYAGAELATMLNVALLVEVIMAWPGVGRLAWLSLRDQDVFLLLGTLVCGAVLVLVGNLLADCTLARVDPRVRLESSDG